MALGPQKKKNKKTKAEIESRKYNPDWDQNENGNDDVEKEISKSNGHRGACSAGVVLIRPSEYGPGWSDRLVTESRRPLSGGENRSAEKQ